MAIIDVNITTPNLQEVTDSGNTTNNDVAFTDNAGILLENTSRLREGTLDSGAGGGIAQICAVGYELKWEAGSQYVMDGNGTLIREVNHKFNIVPDLNNDSTEGFYVGSRWILDNGDVYVCTDSTSTAAVWEIIPNADWNATSGSTAIANKPSIPSIAGLVPDTRNLTINGVTYDLSADRSWVIAATASTLQHEVKAGEAMTKGQAVYVSSADGTNMIVSKASNVSEPTSSKTMGLIIQNLAANGKGYVITEGLLTGLNTASANAGDPVWLGTGGNLIYGLINKPAAPAHLVFIGIVTRANASNGEIFVRVQNGFELQELHNVDITSVANNDLLQYDSATLVWKNESLSTAGIQPTLVSGTSIKTINGNSLLGSGDLVISGGGGAIEVGTTAVTSGTDTRVFFQQGGVVQQDANFTFNNTQKRLTLRAVGTASTDIPFAIRNNTDTFNLLNVNGLGRATFSFDATNADFIRIEPQLSEISMLSYGGIKLVSINNSTSYFGFGVAGYKMGVGNNSPQARLDVRAQGALSTDIAFRVRNSANTADIINVKGNGDAFIGLDAGRVNTGANNSFFGQYAGFNNTTGANNSFFGVDAARYISNGSTSNSISNNSVFLGMNTKALANNQTNQIVIGYDAIGAGSNTATIGNTSIVKTILRGTLNAANLPMSPTGLVTGDIWNNLGILTIV